MISKIFTRTVKSDDYEIIDDSLIKSAEFRLPDDIKYDPDFLYLKLRAVSAGEAYGCNKNGDFFPEKELLKSHKTFLQAHAFKNHNNKDVAGAIGDVLTSEWDSKMKTVILLIRIDRNIAPAIVRGFEKGYMTDVSMGCRVNHVICSYCGKKAKKRSEYCDHLLTMKKKILDNGIQVFEINIEPKFHDISAVLNGAEKVAKVTGIYINNGKVAFYEDDEIEKAASAQEFSQSLIPNNQLAELNRYAEMSDSLDKVAFDSTNFIDKIAEIKKELQAKVLQTASGEYLIDRFKKAADLRDLIKLVYTKYWDRDKCEMIAEKLREMAFDKDIPVPCVFNQFLRVLDFAGIELTPLELKMISCKLMSEDVEDIDSDEEVNESIVGEADNISESNDIGNIARVPEIFEAIRSMVKQRDHIDNITNGPDKAKRLKAIIIKIKRPMSDPRQDILNNIMDFIKPEMPERSYHRNFIVKRMGNPVAFNNMAHFAPIRGNGLQDMLNTILYSSYQGDRVRRFNDGDLDFGFSKFAAYIDEDNLENRLMLDIEKSAGVVKDFGKSLLIGAPLTFGYSALQRSRIKNGENVSGFNRYVAENPANAFAVQALGVPILKNKARKLVAGTKKGLSSLGEGAKKAGGKVKSFFSSENMGKKAHFMDDENINKVALESFSHSQLAAIKKATVLADINEDASLEILASEGLTENAVADYLKISSNCLRIELEDMLDKEASFIGSTLKDAASMLMFSKKNPVMSSNLPGALVDGLAFTFIGKKLADSAKKNKVNKPSENIIKSDMTDTK